jgi:predicted ATPase/transcriptional regulator with XRE-family HTH domain
VTRTREGQSFGPVLRRYRLAARLSQEALAERAGISLRGLSDLERGLSRAPRLETLARLAEALGLEGAARQALATAGGYPPVDDEPLEAPAATLTSAGRARVHTGLPGYLTALLGREDDQSSVSELLRRPEVRLLTLTGPGGVGKTRLAVQVGANLGEVYPDGVVFVALAPLRDPALVTAAMAQAVGVGEAGEVSLLDSIVQALRTQRLLLLLDNFEHVLAEAPTVSDLLVRCPGLDVLVTSRTLLRVQGEHSFPVQPLTVPGATQATTPEAAIGWPAVALFLQRARAVQPAFALTPDNVEAVVDISRRLDGLPLALELAAARVAVLPPVALLARLQQHHQVLSGGPRDAPIRHQALGDAIAWSHDLLSEADQRVFRRLSAFAGGWTLTAAEEVCGDPDADPSVLDSLAALVEQSLIQPTSSAGGEPRFGLLETIRVHALDRLESSGEASAIRRRHATTFLALASEAEPHLISAARAPWLRRLDLELDNMRAALAWSMSPDGDVDLGQRLLGSLSWFWYLRGRLQEARMWAERLLARTTPANPTTGRARALFVLGGISIMQGDAATAHQALDACAEWFRSEGDLPRLTQVLSLLGMATASLGAPTVALDLYRQSVELAQAIGDTWLEAFTLTNEGAARIQVGEPGLGDERYRASLALFDRLDDPWGRSIALRGLAGLALGARDYAAARARYEESVPLFRQTGDTRGLAQALLGLGRTALRDGAAAYAADVFAEALASWKDLGIDAGVVRCLAGLAAAAAADGQLERAARLYAATTAQARAVGVSFSATDTLEHDRSIADLRAQLNPARFAECWAAGQAMGLDDAVADVLGPPHRSL